MIVARGRLEAAGTLTASALVGVDGDFEATGLAVAIAVEPDVVVNESGKTLNRVQNGLNLQLNSWSSLSGVSAFNQLANYSILGGSATLAKKSRVRAPSLGGGGERRRRPSELQFASPPVATRNGLARPRPEARQERPKTTQTVKNKPLENGKDPKNYPQIVLQTPLFIG